MDSLVEVSLWWNAGVEINWCFLTRFFRLFKLLVQQKDLKNHTHTHTHTCWQLFRPQVQVPDYLCSQTQNMIKIKQTNPHLCASFLLFYQQMVFAELSIQLQGCWFERMKEKNMSGSFAAISMFCNALVHSEKLHRFTVRDDRYMWLENQSWA